MFYHFVITKALNLSHEKWTLVYLDQYKNIKTKGYMEQQYPYSIELVKNIVVILHIYGARAISLLFHDHQHTESE